MKERLTGSLIFGLLISFVFSISAVAQVKQDTPSVIDGISIQKSFDPRTGTHLYYLSNLTTVQKKGILPGIDRPEVNFWSYISGLSIRKVFDPPTGTYLHYLSNDSYDLASTEFTLRLYNYRPNFDGRDDDSGVSFNVYILKNIRVDFRDETTGGVFYSQLNVTFQRNNWDDERFFGVVGGVMRSARFARAKGKAIVLRFKIHGMGYGISLDGEGNVSEVTAVEIFVSVEDSYFEDWGERG